MRKGGGQSHISQTGQILYHDSRAPSSRVHWGKMVNWRRATDGGNALQLEVGKRSGFWRSPHYYSSTLLYCTLPSTSPPQPRTLPASGTSIHDISPSAQSNPQHELRIKPPTIARIATYIFPSTAPPQNPSCQSFRHIVGYCIHTSHDCLAVCSTSLQLQWKFAGRGIVQVSIADHKLVLSCLPSAFVLIEADKDGFLWTILDNISMTGASAFWFHVPYYYSHTITLA
ncbi:hypothetical protein BO82DRAFT_68899 [Aspergillus uvarum CBS 121591]|uniref:Uncharacterized protein n=1 Tax=Aspergillus uvarum CBS 121591 TaxID=1448315 RepID=A0A319D2L0_9EURO|nr:hypothetical protein BO82DRAFT_68899 [Aspergillus uvarum CBS 121591]PYH82158.1 hypothetical protein BO82DRAFT_68899 [Aspergillus uvarum CBS 121591]